MLSADRMARYVHALSDQHPDITCMLICIDGDEFTPDQLRRRVVQPQRQLNRTASVPIGYVVVDRSLEGWLACDEGALRAVLGPRARIRITGNPESHREPAEVLRRVFRDNRKRFVKTRHDPLIAQRVSPSAIAARSATFSEFVQTVEGIDRGR